MKLAYFGHTDIVIVKKESMNVNVCSKKNLFRLIIAK